MSAPSYELLQSAHRFMLTPEQLALLALAWLDETGIMSSPNGQTPGGRLRKLEAAVTLPRCKGQEWRVVIGDAPMQDPTCPACGRVIHVLHIFLQR